MTLSYNVILTSSSNSIKVIMSNPYAPQTSAIWGLTEKGKDWLKENCKKEYKIANSYPADRAYGKVFGMEAAVVVNFECEKEAALFKLFFK